MSDSRNRHGCFRARCEQLLSGPHKFSLYKETEQTHLAQLDEVERRFLETYLRSPEGLVELNCDIVVDGISEGKRFELYSRFSNDYI